MRVVALVSCRLSTARRLLKPTTLYDEDLEATPFMNELAQKSLLAEKAYAIVPHTTNALAATNCGMDPR